MNTLMSMTVIFFACLIALFFLAVIAVVILYFFDKYQSQHAILRNFPVIGRLRYLFEHIAPEMKQYFGDDNAGRPYSNNDMRSIVKAGKYIQSIIALGSERDFDKPGFYIRNAFFANQLHDMNADNEKEVKTQRYTIDKESLFARKEHVEKTTTKPWLLSDENSVVIGEKTCKYPFKTKSLVGMSGMSWGALGNNAIQALSLGIGYANAFMNTGEGGLSPYHLKGDADIICQIGPGKFGFRNLDGSFSYEKLKEKAALEQVKAFELKLGQGAKIRGGHVEGSKVTPEIAEVRGVEPWKTIDSPNRFDEFHDYPSMFDFIEKIREVAQKPVGIKIVIGSEDSFEEFVQYMKEHNRFPDFISIDGSEGGTGATYQAMADSMGLPIKPALLIANRILKKYGVRDHVKIIASGKLFSADKIAIALSMGADLVQIARGMMVAVGCIGAKKCHSNDCPVGVATTDPKLQEALVVDEKKYRVTNYICTLRAELFALAAAAGLKCPTEFSEKHVIFVSQDGKAVNLEKLNDEIFVS